MRAWATLTSQAPVGRIRATVRAGRDRMRTTLLGWLPADLHGARVLDAGCGTGALAIDLARRGASVVAVDLSPNLVALASQRLPAPLQSQIQFIAGDMLDPSYGTFDYTVAMDSLIHYPVADMADIVATLGARTRKTMVFTFAPRTPVLAAMHLVGGLFPTGNRAPSIEPVSDAKLLDRLGADARLSAFDVTSTRRVSSGFYISQGVRLARAAGRLT